MLRSEHYIRQGFSSNDISVTRNHLMWNETYAAGSGTLSDRDRDTNESKTGELHHERNGNEAKSDERGAEKAYRKIIALLVRQQHTTVPSAS